MEITVEGLRLELARKPIKHLRIVVAPPDGQVRVSAPRHWPETAVRAAVTARLPWIRRHIAHFSAQPKRPPPQYLAGESHWIWGVEHRLELVEAEGAARVENTADGRLRILARPGAGLDQRQRLLQQWYRSLLQARIEGQLDVWQQALGVSVSDWGIKRMKTRWGTCNISARRIWLNLALAQLPPECCQYVLVHELAHLLERRHNSRFWSILDHHLPDWRAAQALLSQLEVRF